MTRSHVFQVPFPEAGHAINMFNVGTVLATSNVQVHTLVLSRRNAEKWLKATGQPSNTNLNLEVIASGKWEEWAPVAARDMVMICRTPEFNAAIDEAIKNVKKQFPKEIHTTIIFNPLMADLMGIAQAHNLKRFLLNPTPFYMYRLSGAQKLDGSSKPTDPVTYQGIGGSNTDMPAILGDAIDMIGPMYQMSKPCMEAADGVIYSNTNEGLEGDNYLQPQMPDCNKQQVNYMIGPILPPQYEVALDNPEALHAQRAKADQSDACIQFLNQQPPQSVVYVTFGSAAQTTINQAKMIIQALRKYKQPWVFLFREGSDALEAAIGDHPDGHITTWAPQLDVLLHPATKCVLSHGGFGTMIEGVFAGQPFICSPIFSDQFLDTRVMQHLGICVGNIAINNFEPVMTRSDLAPRWPDDGGKTMDTVFEQAFGNKEVLKRARNATLALRARMVRTKTTRGLEVLKSLRIEVENEKPRN